MLVVFNFSKSQKRRVGGSKKHEFKLMWPYTCLCSFFSSIATELRGMVQYVGLAQGNAQAWTSVFVQLVYLRSGRAFLCHGCPLHKATINCIVVSRPVCGFKGIMDVTSSDWTTSRKLDKINKLNLLLASTISKQPFSVTLSSSKQCTVHGSSLVPWPGHSQRCIIYQQQANNIIIVLKQTLAFMFSYFLYLSFLCFLHLVCKREAIKFSNFRHYVHTQSVRAIPTYRVNY